MRVSPKGREARPASHPHFVRYLRQFDDGTHLYQLSTSELIEQFWAAVNVAELVHSFGSSAAKANCGFDLTIPMGIKAPRFWNQWQLQALKMVRQEHDTCCCYFSSLGRRRAPKLEILSPRAYSYAEMKRCRSPSTLRTMFLQSGVRLCCSAFRHSRMSLHRIWQRRRIALFMQLYAVFNAHGEF